MHLFHMFHNIITFGFTTFTHVFHIFFWLFFGIIDTLSTTVSMPDMSLGMNGLIADTNDFSNLNLNNLFNYRDYIMF
jgi:hypothetical protein